MNSQREAIVLVFCIRPVGGKNKAAILKREGVFSLILIQNICHIMQAETMQHWIWLGRDDLPTRDLDWAARIDDADGQNAPPI